MKLQGKVVILTGASSGIGREVALLFAKEGAKVMAAARRLEKLEELVAIQKAEGFAGEIIPVETDVAIPEHLDRLVDQTLERFGTVDVLVNNAGILDNYQSLEHVEDDVWHKIFDVNVHSVMALSRRVISVMKEKKSGVIINTASVGGLHGMRGGLGYVATKHALVGMTKNIGYSYAQDGIRCNAIAPGSIGTEIGQKVSNPDMVTLEKLMAGFKMFPAMGKADELAHSYLFLASDDSRFVNGTVLVVDGGWTAF